MQFRQCFLQAVKIEYMEPDKYKPVKEKKGKTKHFTRLTLGDSSPELGTLWDD
jgi:hypothetical protein